MKSEEIPVATATKMLFFRHSIPGVKHLQQRYEVFSRELPSMCMTFGLDEVEISYIDLEEIISTWIENNPPRVIRDDGS